MLESEGNALPVEQFARGVAALRKENPDDPDLLLFEGAALAWRSAISRHDEAQSEGNFRAKATKLAPKFPEAYYYWGNLLLSPG